MTPNFGSRRVRRAISAGTLLVLLLPVVVLSGCTAAGGRLADDESRRQVEFQVTLLAVHPDRATKRDRDLLADLTLGDRSDSWLRGGRTQSNLDKLIASLRTSDAIEVLVRPTFVVRDGARVSSEMSQTGTDLRVSARPSLREDGMLAVSVDSSFRSDLANGRWRRLAFDGTRLSLSTAGLLVAPNSVDGRRVTVQTGSVRPESLRFYVFASGGPLN